MTDALEAILQVWDNDAGADVDPAAVPVGHSIQVNLNDGFTLNKEATEGTIVTISLNDVDISDSHAADEFHYVAFEMPDEDSSLVVEPESEPEEYDVNVVAWGGDFVTLGSYFSGTEVNATYDTNFGNIVGVVPANLQYILTDEDLTFTMPDEEVKFISELPETGTTFDFTGYEHEEDETPSSTGTVTYDGIYEDDSTYIMGTATVTFTGAQQEVEQTVYISRSDTPNMKQGTRIPVYVMNNDQLVPFGYGELNQQ